MTIQVEFWQLVGLLLSFIGFAAGCVKLLFEQHDRRQGDRIRAIYEALTNHTADERRTTEAYAALERDFLRFQADLPTLYVRREDYLRSQTVIESKLDGVALKIENLLLKGHYHD